MPFEDSSHTGHALRQLQDSWQSTAAGAAADTNITVTGAKVGDTVKVIAFSSGTPSIPSGAVTVTAADTIQIASVTTGATSVVTVYPKSA